MKIKSTKFSLDLFLCIFLAILTVLSFVLSFSGAWFTSSKKAEIDNISLRFGSVRLGENFNSATISNLVPTETIPYYGATSSQDIDYEGTVDAYYRIKFDITDLDGNNNLDTDAFKAYLYFSGHTNAQYINLENNVLYGMISPENSIPRGSIKLSKEASNDYANKEYKIKIIIDLIQVQNLGAIYGIGNMSSLTNYENLFVYYDSNTNA